MFQEYTTVAAFSYFRFDYDNDDDDDYYYDDDDDDDDDDDSGGDDDNDDDRSMKCAYSPIIKRKMGRLKTHSVEYCINDIWDIFPN